MLPQMSPSAGHPPTRWSVAATAGGAAGSGPCRRRTLTVPTPARGSVGGGSFSRGLEPVHPAARYPEEALRVEAVEPLATALLDGDQPRLLQDLKVPSCSRPGARESGCDVARGHLAATKVKGQEDVPTLLVGESGEDRFKVGKLPVGR